MLRVRIRGGKKGRKRRLVRRVLVVRGVTKKRLTKTKTKRSESKLKNKTKFRCHKFRFERSEFGIVLGL